MTIAAPHRIHGTRVLLVSDNAELSKRLETLLLEHQFSVDVETGTEPALARLEERRYELLWLDMAEALKSDFEILKTISARSLRTVALIADRGASDELAVNTALAHGAQDILLASDSDLEFYQASENAMNIIRSKQKQKPEDMSTDDMREFFMDHAKDMIFTLDSEGCFVYLNPKASEVLGYSTAELSGQPFNKIVHPRDTGKVSTAMQLLSANKTSHDLQLNLLPSQNDSRSEKLFFDIAIRRCQGPIPMLAGIPGDHAFFASARDATEKHRAHEQAIEQAFCDPVTRLPNRSLFINRLQRDLALAKRDQNKLAVLFLDLNGFKKVNDKHSPDTGNALLAAIAKRLQATLRTTDTLARFGGDEFTVILNDIQSPERANVVAEKLLIALKRPFQIDGLSLRVGASIGYAVYPDTAGDAQQLIDQADEAMYIAKGDLSKDIAAYTEDRGRSEESLPGHRELLEFIESGAFSLRYSPVVGVKKRLIHSIEAKMRFHHASLAGLKPPQFDQLINSHKLGGEWFLATLQKVAGEITDIAAAIKAGGLRLALEAPASMLQQNDFAERVLDCLAQHDISGDLLEIIVPEIALEGERKAIKAQFKALGDAGISLSIRNFGSGNASIYNLAHMNIAGLRLSRQLTTHSKPNAPDLTVARAIAAITATLNIELIAEDIETLQQLRCAAELDCSGAQGIILSNDLNINELTARLHSQVRSKGRPLKVLQGSTPESITETGV